MGLTNPSEEQPKCHSKKLISFTFCCLLCIALIQFHFSATPFSFSSTEQLLCNKPVLSTTTTSSSTSSSSSKGIYNTYLMFSTFTHVLGTICTPSFLLKFLTFNLQFIYIVLKFIIFCA